MAKGVYQSIVQRRSQLLKVQPDIEGTGRHDVDVQMELFESLQNVIAFCLEMLLQGNLYIGFSKVTDKRRMQGGTYPLLKDTAWLQEVDGSKLHAGFIKGFSMIPG